MIDQNTNNRIGGWIQTYLRKKFYPLDAKPEEIYIEDIGYALSNQCRFSGHTNRFYSVAEHCCYVSDALPNEHKLAGLLHDASEAYCVDLPTPLKILPEFVTYRNIEDKLMSVIGAKWGFEWPLDPIVHNADKSVFANEVLALMTPTHPDFFVPYEPIKQLNIGCWPPKKARKEFFDRYYNLI